MKNADIPPAWMVELERWRVVLRAGGRPDTTIRLRTYHVGRLGAWCGGQVGPWQVTGADVLEWAAAHDWARNTRRSVRSSLVGFYRWGVKAGRCSSSPADALEPVRQTDPAPRPAADAAYRAALEAADPAESLMVRLAGELGMRRGEVCQVHARDVVPDIVGWSLRVHGKGGKDRVVPMPDGLAAAVRAMCEAGGGFAFPGAVDGHMSAHWVGKRVGRLLPDGVTMHALRHRFATRAYAVDTDILTVQQLLGHASPATTQRYVRVDAGALRSTVLRAGSAA